MATYHKFAFDRFVRYRLELRLEANVLRVGGELTRDGFHFMIDSALGLLDSEHTDLVLDLRRATSRSSGLSGAVSWMMDAAEARGKHLSVLACGETYHQLEGAGQSAPTHQTPVLAI